MKKMMLMTAFVLSSMNAMAQVQDNPVTWTTINGQQWSNVLEGHPTNVDLDGTKPVNGIVQKTPATEACKAVGGRLPTKDDFIALCKTTDQFTIPGMANAHLWTSSTEENPKSVYLFWNCSIFRGGFQLFNYPVVCIKNKSAEI